MKLENDHVIGVQTPPRKSYNPFDSDDEDTDAYAKSSIHGYDIKSFETTADSLTFHLDSSDLSWEEAILSHSRMISNSMVADASLDKVLYRKDTELFTDKTITECELPESVFSNKDNDFHSVKDIGIDEGVPTLDKVWIKSQDDHDCKTLPGVDPDNNVKGDLPYEVGVKSQPENDVDNDLLCQARTDGSLKENGIVHEDLDKLYSADQCKTDNLVKVDEFEHNSSKTEIESNSSWQGTKLVENSSAGVNGEAVSNLRDKDEDNHKVEEKGNKVDEKQYHLSNAPLQNAEESPAKPSIEHDVEANIESNKNQSEEVDSVRPVELPAFQEPDGTGNGATNTMSYNSKVESGSIILDFKGSGKEKEEISRKSDAVEKPPETQAMSRGDGAAGPSILDGGTDKRVHGETSFSSAMPLPASMTYMGPHMHNGSISLRSESSTGSTRSFAFPVLQTEWNSSPVRMAKADQRQLHKQKGWVHSLICCKF